MSSESRFDPFDSFARRLDSEVRKATTVQRLSAAPIPGINPSRTAADEHAPERDAGVCRVRIRVRRNGRARANEPYEIEAGGTRVSGKLDGNGRVRLAVHADSRPVRLRVGRQNPLNLLLSLAPESTRVD